MIHPLIPSAQDLQATHSRLRPIPQPAPRPLPAQTAGVIGNSAANQVIGLGNTLPPIPPQKTNFPKTAATIGTEQELPDIKVRIPTTFMDKKLGIIHVQTTGGLCHLWDITKDLLFNTDPKTELSDYTLEMVSSPTPIENEEDWNTRQEAFNEFVKESRLISFSPIKQRNLVTKNIGRFRMTMLTPVKIVIADEHMDTMGSSFQYTKGVTLSMIPNLMAEERAPWFRHDLIEWAAPLQDEPSQIVFAYVMSVALKDCEIYCSLFKKDVDTTNTLILSSTAKNLWGILPRMPLRTAITLLPPQRQQDVLNLVTSFQITPVEPMHIFTGRYNKLVGTMLGTQTVIRVGEIDTNDTIDGQPIFLFENRLPGPLSPIPAYVKWNDSQATIPSLNYSNCIPFVYNSVNIGKYRTTQWQMEFHLTIEQPFKYQPVLQLGTVNFHPNRILIYKIKYKIDGKQPFNGWMTADPNGTLTMKFPNSPTSDPGMITMVTADEGDPFPPDPPSDQQGSPAASSEPPSGSAVSPAQ